MESAANKVMPAFEFLQGLDRDIQQSLLKQLRDLWTHTSTALEGNTLSLGDTHFVLEEGLTVSGKPLKDHQEIVGHARAIDIIYSCVGREINEEDVFDLHKAVQTEKVSDIYKPYGEWKVDDDDQQIYIEYAQPQHVPALMKELINSINRYLAESVQLAMAPAIYANIHMGVAHIHPFWDGNGRIARLLANLPLLNSGLPPLVINKEERRNYISVLSRYQREIGALTENTGIWPKPEKLNAFTQFCTEAYHHTQELVEKAKEQQRKREVG